MKNTINEINLKYKPTKAHCLKITSSRDAYKVLLELWNSNTIELFEEFKVLLLNNSNYVIGFFTVSRGGITSTLIDLRLLFATILKSGATGIICSHNHPSGSLSPSTADKNIYKKIKEIATFHDISVLDNLIVTPEGYFSFADECI